MEHSPKVIATILPIILLLYINSLPFKIQASPLIMWSYHCTNSSGSYTDFSMFQAILNVLISDIETSTQVTGGFYNLSVGNGKDQVNAIGICRGDATSSVCLACLQDTVYKLPEKCPTQKEAICWYTDCMLRYSPRDIFHKMETSPRTCLINLNNVSNANLLNRTRAGLLQTLKIQAVANTVPYVSMGEVNEMENDQTVYVMVQCTPDINASACLDCLDVAIQALQGCSYANIGGRMLLPSCGVRYESARFFNVTLPGAPPPRPSPSPAPNPQETTKTCTFLPFHLKILIETIFKMIRRKS